MLFQQAPPDWLSLWLQVSRQLRRQLAERYAAAGLTESRAAVLEALLVRSQRCTQADLASDLHLSESNLCALIERMRKEGLIQRERSELDRRKTLLSITSHGRTLGQAVQQIHSQCQRDLARQFTPHADSGIRDLMSLLLKGLQELEVDTTPARRAA